MSFLVINLLGPFQVTVAGSPATGFDSDKVRALLAYLVVEAGRPHRREALAGLLWPEWNERKARTNLRRALANLRQVIGDRVASPPLLEISRQTIQFNTAGDHWLDVAAFSQMATGDEDLSGGIKQLEEAAALYRGPFLEGFTLADSAAFEQWQLINREALQHEMVAVLRRLADHDEQRGLFSPALSPDGAILAATSFNAQSQRLTTHVWDVATGEEINVIGFGDQVGGLAFSPDGSTLAVPGAAGRLTLWDPLTGDQVLSMREDGATATDLVFSPDGRLLATSNINGTARLWELDSREIVITLRGHSGPVYGIDYSPDGRLIATAGDDGTVRVWSADSGRELLVFYGHEDIVLNVSFSPDGRRLASGGSDNKTIIWDISQ